MKLNIINGNWQRFDEIRATLDKEKRWTVDIREQKSTRSINQHGLYFAHVTELAAEQGLTKDEVHLYNKRHFFLPIYERDGYPYEDLPDLMETLRSLYRMGEEEKAEKFLQFVVNSISTTKADTKQMSEALDDIDKDAITRLQLILPQPGEPTEG